jgi:hypothetical protein
MGSNELGNGFYYFCRVYNSNGFLSLILYSNYVGIEYNRIVKKLVTLQEHLLSTNPLPKPVTQYRSRQKGIKNLILHIIFELCKITEYNGEKIKSQIRWIFELFRRNF